MSQWAALEVRDGFLNIKNPACFLNPEENGCQPGDHFAASEIETARDFTNYRAIPFATPLRQRIANWLSLIVLIAVAGAIAAAAGKRLWRTHRPTRPGRRLDRSDARRPHGPSPA